MKKIISQISLILLIMIIGLASGFISKVQAADSIAGLNCPTSVKEGNDFKVALILPDGTYAANATVTVVYNNDNSKKQTQELVYVSGMADFPNFVSFNAKYSGTAKVTASNIVLSNAASEPIEEGKSKSATITVTPKNPTPPPSTGNTTNSGTTGNTTGSGSSGTNNQGSSGSTGGNQGSSTGGTTSSGNTTSGNNSSSGTTSTTPKFTTVNETVVTTERCNLRESYSTSSNKVAVVDADTKLTRKGIGDNGWSKVEYNGKTVYVSSQYIKVVPEDEEKEPEKVTFKDTHENLYAKQDCNLRASWSTESEKVGYLKKGQPVERTGYADNGWSRILYDGKVVYVASRLLVVEKPEEDEEENTVTNENVINNNTNIVTNEVIDPTQMSEEDRLEELEEEIGVLPEVGINAANIAYVVVTIIAIAGVISGYIYTKKIK